MFTLVESTKERALFKELFFESVEKYDFKYNEPKAKEERFLILKRSVNEGVLSVAQYEEELTKNAIGTVELNPFNANGHSIVQSYSTVDLSEHPKIKNCDSEIYEIGKLYIQERYQNRGFFKNLLLIVNDHSERTDAKKYIAQMVLPLFEIFQSQFGDCIEQIGPPDNDLVPGVPVLINVEKMKENSDIIRLVSRYSKLTV